VKGTSRESMGESYSFYRREVDYKGLNGVVTTTIYHTIRNIEGVLKLASLSTTLTLNMQVLIQERQELKYSKSYEP
jgi:hypothetical protein